MLDEKIERDEMQNIIFPDTFLKAGLVLSPVLLFPLFDSW
jgi:hypothetical protein